MATLRSKRKLAAVTREIQDENPRSGQSRNTSVPRINEDYLTQLSEEIEGRITKKLSREFSRIESRISDALSKLDEVLSNQQIQTYSETVPGTFRNTNVENQGTNEDNSQSDPHPEGGLFRSQTTQNSGPEAGHYNHNISAKKFFHKIFLVFFVHQQSGRRNLSNIEIRSDFLAIQTDILPRLLDEFLSSRLSNSSGQLRICKKLFQNSNNNFFLEASET